MHPATAMPPDPERVKQIVSAALDLPENERDEYIQQACGADADLLEAVRARLGETISLHVNKTRTVAPGDVLADRFRVLRFIAHGGMGEVFEAEDLVLHHRVALKFIRPELAQDRGLMARFRNEVRLARTITDPRVCRVHDLHQHTKADGKPLTFLSMQFLEGETLSARLRRGPLSPAEALPIIADVALGLDAAHQLGVVHRDLKPSNIVLTSGDVPRAVVMDFGLALDITAAQPNTAITDATGIVGTPEYMSPEQVEVQDVGPATDIYSFGIVIFEMMTGKRPFTGPSAMAIAVKRLTTDPPPLRERARHLPPVWHDVVHRCLARNPAERFKRASEIPRELTAGNGHAAAKQQSRGTFMYVLAGLVLAAIGIASWWFFRPPIHTPPPQAVYWYDEGIAALRDATYDKAGRAFEQAVNLDPKFAMAHARLAESWLEREQYGKADRELLAGGFGGPTAPDLLRSDRIYVEAVRKSLIPDYDGAIAEWKKLVDDAAEKDKPAAYVDLGRAYERANKVTEAIKSYEAALLKNPQYPAALLRVASLYARTQNPRAEETFKKAEDLYNRLSKPEAVTELYIQRGLQLTQLNRPSESIPILEKALHLATENKNEYQQTYAVLLLSLAMTRSGKPADAINYATDGIALADKAGFINLKIRALTDLGTAELIAGRRDDAEAHWKSALELARREKSPRYEARASLSLGNLHIMRGDATTALKELQPALDFYRRAGFRNETASALILMGRAFRDQGNLSQGFASFQQALEIASAADDRSQMAICEEALGSILIRQEQYPGALGHFTASYKLNESVRSAALIARAVANRGQTLWHLGNYSDGRAALQDAARKAETLHDATFALEVRLFHAELELSMGDFSRARSLAGGILAAAPPDRLDLLAGATRVRGLADVQSGAKQQGLRACESARNMLRNSQDRFLLSEAELAYGFAAFESGQYDSAREVTIMLGPQFHSARQSTSEWMAHTIAAAALGAARNPAAHSYAAEARGVLEKIRQEWGQVYFTGYTSRPDVKYYLQMLAQASR